MKICNSNYDTQSFGMALKLEDTANQALINRVKANDMKKVTALLDDLKDKKNYLVDIYTKNDNSTRLKSVISRNDDKAYWAKKDESLLSNPIDFLRSLVKKLNLEEKKAAEIAQKEDMLKPY